MPKFVLRSFYTPVWKPRPNRSNFIAPVERKCEYRVSDKAVKYSLEEDHVRAMNGAAASNNLGHQLIASKVLPKDVTEKLEFEQYVRALGVKPLVRK